MTESSIQFHIEKNDFFGTLATVIDLVSQDLQKNGSWRSINQRDSSCYGSSRRNTLVAAPIRKAIIGWTRADALEPPTPTHFAAARTRCPGVNAGGISFAGIFNVLAVIWSSFLPPHSIATAPPFRNAANGRRTREAIQDRDVRNIHSSTRILNTISSLATSPRCRTKSSGSSCRSKACFFAQADRSLHF
jgi:hypothetical protein